MKSKPDYDNEFGFIEFTDEMREHYGLPNQPCPIRLPQAEEMMMSGGYRIDSLADECHLYIKTNEDEKEKFKELLLRLCTIAGVSAGKSGNAPEALRLLRIAYDLAPSSEDVTVNMGMALSQSKQYDEAIEIFEKLLSSVESRKGFIPQLWGEAAYAHYLKGNYQRALSLMEYAIWVDPDDFGSRALDFACELLRLLRQSEDQK